MPFLFSGKWSTAQAPSPETPRYIPTFEPVVTFQPVGGVNRYANRDYFATEETTIWVMRTFSALWWFAVKQPGSTEGLYSANYPERWVHFADGLEANAGLIAAAYQRNAVYSHENGLRAAREHIALARLEWEQRKAQGDPIGLERLNSEGGGTSGGGGGD